MTSPATTHLIPPAPFAGQEGADGGDEIFITLPGGVEMLFCWCPRPERPFQIGSPVGEAQRDDDEKPTWITLSQGFWLAKHPCSQAQWQAAGMANSSKFSGDLSRPVDNVSSKDAYDFFKRVTVPTGWRMALPTEAQWEYACRSGSSLGLPFGIGDQHTLHSQIANFNGGESYQRGFNWTNREQTLPCGSFPPNAWGLHDMHGQLWEWCADWKANYPASSVNKPLIDHTGPVKGEGRSLRGGSYLNAGSYCRAACRPSYGPDERYFTIGLRPTLVAGASTGRGERKKRGGTTRKQR